jgi:hypothetical protein
MNTFPEPNISGAFPVLHRPYFEPRECGAAVLGRAAA